MLNGEFDCKIYNDENTQIKYCNKINTNLLTNSIDHLINDTLDYIVEENVNIYHLLFVFVLNDIYSGIILFNMILENIEGLTSSKVEIIKNRLDDDKNLIYPLMLSTLIVLHTKMQQEYTKEYHHIYKNIYNMIETKLNKQLTCIN
jgi:hypothetical protein